MTAIEANGSWDTNQGGESGNTAQNNSQLTQTELHMYGSSRLGVYNVQQNVQTDTRIFYALTGTTISAELLTFSTGNKFFELSNHLGNVLVTVTDKSLAVDADGNGTTEFYAADVVTAQDYCPFGMTMPGRSYSASSSSYRYGFNGKENDSEVKGEGNQIDYGWRVYDPRIGKFLSVDPLQSTYPELTPYQFAGNTPIQAVDLDGREIYHYTLFFQADGKAPILTYVGEQKNEMGTWPLDAIDRGKSEGFKTYNGDKITTKSIQVHVVAVEGGGIAYKPAEATVTFSSFKAMNDWSAAGYQGTEDEIAFIGGFQQKLEEGVFIASVTTPSASPVSRAGRGAASAGAKQSPKGTTAKQATAVNGKQLTKAEMAQIKGGSLFKSGEVNVYSNGVKQIRPANVLENLGHPGQAKYNAAVNQLKTGGEFIMKDAAQAQKLLGKSNATAIRHETETLLPGGNANGHFGEHINFTSESGVKSTITIKQ